MTKIKEVLQLNLELQQEIEAGLKKLETEQETLAKKISSIFSKGLTAGQVSATIKV